VFRNGKEKWKVGEVRQVVVDKEPVWYCPKCKNWIISLPKSFKKFKHPDKVLQCEVCCYHGIMKLLRIKVLSIREQKLLDITNADAERCGFKKTKVYGTSPLGNTKSHYSAKENFTLEFCEIYGLTHKLIFMVGWNPSVWAIEFEVI